MSPAPRADQSNEVVGILGGAFNPIHVGHLNAALTVRGKLNLDKVIFIPNANPPLKEFVGPSGQDRLAMVEAAIAPYRPELEISDAEVKRGGVSYSFETLRELERRYKSENMYFIIGADAFLTFPQWKNFRDLLALANFVVTTRPGTEISLDREDLPEGLAPFVKSSQPGKLILKSGRTIQKVELEDIDVSATEIRKRLRLSQNTKEWLPEAVKRVIEERGLYKKTSPLIHDYREFALYLAKKALDKKALALKIYDMSRMSSYADYSIICSATSSRHGASVAENLVEAAKQDFGISPLSIEGLREGQWVLIDYGAIVIHVFQDAVRSTYKIEELWKSCPQLQNEIAAPERAPAGMNL